MLPNKPTICKRIGNIDTKPFIDFLDDIELSENLNYNRDLFFHGCRSYFVIEHDNISDESILEKFINISGELIESLQLSYGKGSSSNIQFSLLSPGGKIEEHVDEGDIFEESHRIHLPLITNNKVDFYIDGKLNYFKEGEVVEINNQKCHSVINNHKTKSRLHLIIDYIPYYRSKLRH